MVNDQFQNISQSINTLITNIWLFFFVTPNRVIFEKNFSIFSNFSNFDEFFQFFSISGWDHVLVFSEILEPWWVLALIYDSRIKKCVPFLIWIFRNLYKESLPVDQGRWDSSSGCSWSNPSRNPPHLWQHPSLPKQSVHLPNERVRRADRGHNRYRKWTCVCFNVSHVKRYSPSDSSI